MTEPRDINEFKDAILASKEIHDLFLKEGGPDANSKWARFLNGENIEDLYDFIGENKWGYPGNPVSSFDGAAPDNDIFSIDIQKIGPLFFVTANEFDEMAYFGSQKEAEDYAVDYFAPYFDELGRRDREDNWTELGDYTVPGAMPERQFFIDIREERDGDWSARWRGEDDAMEFHEPSELQSLFDELVETYFGKDGVVLAQMFITSDLPELVAFGEAWKKSNGQK